VDARAHHIGQTKDVKVFRLVSRETVEEDIFERAKRKRALEHLVFHGLEGGEQDKDGSANKNSSPFWDFGAEQLLKEIGPSLTTIIL
jgi:SNF2 family DNA or RNA helicase